MTSVTTQCNNPLNGLCKKLLFVPLFLALSLSALEVGEPVPEITLGSDAGGRLDGSSWSSSELQGKVHLLFYVDPDEKDLNNDFSDAIKAEGLDSSKFSSVAIINMAATWKPNFVINAALKKKQLKFKKTLYLKDMEKLLVSKWGVADDNSDVILFDREGRVLFYHAGKIDSAMTKEVIALIKEHM
jgi:predicted transcriptional regulator